MGDKKEDVLFDEILGKEGSIGLITLNRPDVLNSLNHAMVIAMHAKLTTWATASHIKAVVIRAAEGRAFCAGGDLRSTYERYKSHDVSLQQFFRDEYHLNRFIFHFPKPYIALLDGITMGGGVGISIHGSHRIATDRLLFAMPETSIGFFPDVGGTYFLPRLPYQIGFYLGLTGVRLPCDDCVAIGIAQQKMPKESLTDFMTALTHASLSHDPHAVVTQLMEKFKVPIHSSTLMDHRIEINHCFSKHTVENILQALTQSTNLVCQEAISVINKKSPTSLKVTLQALQIGKQLDFDACLRQEYRLSYRFLEGHDFVEGIRALIIDKDQKPIWDPATLEGVTPNIVDHYFAPLAEELA